MADIEPASQRLRAYLKRASDLAFGVHQAGETRRRNAERLRDSGAEHLSRRVDVGDVPQGLWMKLDVAEPTSSIVLHALELELHSASVDVAGKTIPSKNIALDEETQIATLEFEQELKTAKDETTLNIDFTGILNNKMAGFYRSSYIDAKTGEKKWLATTQMGIPPRLLY